MGHARRAVEGDVEDAEEVGSSTMGVSGRGRTGVGRASAGGIRGVERTM